MSRKHNTKHQHTSNGKYEARLKNRGVSSAQVRQSDPRLSDGKPASAKR